MSKSNSYASPYTVAAQPVDARAQFIRKTYAHLGGAILAFALLEYFFLQTPAIVSFGQSMMNNWLFVLIGFMAVSFIAQKWATSATSKSTQYLGLGTYIVAEALLFVPLMSFATAFFDANLIYKEAILTFALFLGMTAIAFVTKKDFSFLNGFLMIGGFVALGLIVASIAFGGFQLGILFCAFMAIFASIAILRDTSNIIHHYGTEQYVAASLGLFASVALLFWYIIQILMSFASND